MEGELLLRERFQLRRDAFAELVVWRVPTPVRGSSHDYKYRLSYVVGRQCVLRFDNEAGKGDHLHRGDREKPYRFTAAAALLEDFWSEVERWDLTSAS